MEKKLQQLNKFFLLIILIYLFRCNKSEESENVLYPRVISLAPNITEIIFALGASNHLVGVTRYCTYPPSAEKITKVGGILDYSKEAILSLKPHFIFAGKAGVSPHFQKIATGMGIKFEFFQWEDFDDLYEGIYRIGKILKVEEKGANLIKEIKNELNKIKKDVKMNHKKPKVLFVVGHNPLFIAGGKSFVGELISLAGGENCAEGAKLPYPQYSMEDIFICNPEIIIDKGIEKFSLSFWMKYENLTAVKRKKIWNLNNDGILRPGPRTPSALKELAEIIKSVCKE